MSELGDRQVIIERLLGTDLESVVSHKKARVNVFRLLLKYVNLFISEVNSFAHYFAAPFFNGLGKKLLETYNHNQLISLRKFEKHYSWLLL
jgi:hypothetical protein